MTAAREDDVKKQAVTYVRSARRNDLAIARQREACLRTAEVLDATVEAAYVDTGASGMTIDRPGLQAMMQCLKERQDVAYVITYAPDRLSRRLGDNALLSAEIEQTGARVVFADGPPNVATEDVHSIRALW